MFCGDAEREAEQIILDSQYADELRSTVIKIGHHGSDSSTTYPFLREIMPEYAVISVGDGNSYGHPTNNTLSRLRDADVQVFRTDMQGDIFCYSDGNSVSFAVDRNPDADTLTTSSTVVTTSHPVFIETEENTSYQPVSQWKDYVLNTNSKKFHYPACDSADQVKGSNRKDYYGSREDLIAQGYSPCGNCKP